MAAPHASSSRERRRDGGRIRRARSPTVACALALQAGALPLAGCGSVSRATRAATAAPVTVSAQALARAAYATRAAPGERVSLAWAITAAGHPTSLAGEGSLADGGRRGSLFLHVAGRDLHEVFDAPYVFVADGSDPAPTRWLRVDMASFGTSTGGLGPLTASSENPADTLSLLQHSGSVMELGRETIRGAPTTHYHALVDTARYATGARGAQILRRIAGSSVLPLDVWVDAAGRVRRLTLRIHLCTPGGGAQESIALEMFGFGPQPVAALPAGARITDVSASARAAAAGALAQLHC